MSQKYLQHRKRNYDIITKKYFSNYIFMLKCLKNSSLITWT